MCLGAAGKLLDPDQLARSLAIASGDAEVIAAGEHLVETVNGGGVHGHAINVHLRDSKIVATSTFRANFDLY